MEEDTRKYSVNIQDPEIARFLLAIDPLNQEVKKEFDFKILDENWISLLGVPIYVRGVIHATANPLDILNGFNLLMSQEKNKTNIDKDKLLLCIYESERLDRNPNIKESELTQPKEVYLRQLLVNVLRLSYYYKCYPVKTFHIKSNEVRTKIATSLTKIVIGGANFEDRINELADVVKNCSSELMFAALVLVAGRKLTFDANHDLNVDDIPCEVKTINDRYFASKDENGRIVFASVKEEFGEVSLSSELIVQVLRIKWKEHLKKAIDHQKGRLVFFNVYSTVLHDLNSRCNIDLSCLTFTELLLNAISSLNADNTIIPLISCSCIVGSSFDQQFFLAKIPVKISGNDTIVDEDSLNESTVSENILYQEYHYPAVAVDVIVEKDDKLLLIRREGKTFQYSLAIPGGFIDKGEKVEDAAVREMKEETNVDVEIIDILGVYSAPYRDPRGHVVTVVFIGKIVGGEPKAGDDAQDIRWIKYEDTLRMRMSSDHPKVLEDYQKWKKDKGTFWSGKACCG